MQQNSLFSPIYSSIPTYVDLYFVLGEGFQTSKIINTNTGHSYRFFLIIFLLVLWLLLERKRREEWEGDKEGEGEVMTWDKADLSVLLIQSTTNLSCSGDIPANPKLFPSASLSRLSQKEKGQKKLPRKCVWERKKSSVPHQVQQWKCLHETFMPTLNII